MFYCYEEEEVSSVGRGGCSSTVSIKPNSFASRGLMKLSRSNNGSEMLQKEYQCHVGCWGEPTMHCAKMLIPIQMVKNHVSIVRLIVLTI